MGPFKPFFSVIIALMVLNEVKNSVIAHTLSAGARTAKTAQIFLLKF
jgi:hypothetical protein